MAGLSTPHRLDHPTTLAAAVLTDDNRVLVVVIGVVALAALVVAGVLLRQVLAAGEGTDSMKKIAAAVQEGANAYLARHSWAEYGAWHLALTEGPADDTKARYAFVYGDFRRVHRMGIIACHYRAAEWCHKEIELAAHDLLQLLDARRA